MKKEMYCLLEEKSEKLVYFDMGRYTFDEKPRRSGIVYAEDNIPKLEDKLDKALRKEINFWEDRILFWKGQDLVRSRYTQADIDREVQGCIDKIQEIRDKQSKLVFKPCKITYETI